MSRVAISDVKNAMDTNLTDPQIQSAIDAAEVMVTAGPAASTNPALGSDELFVIEQYLACHFVNLRDPIALRSRIGDTLQYSFPESVTVAWGKGLNLTIWGQQAIWADRSGALAKLGLMKGSFRAARREDSDFYIPRLTKS